MYEAFFGMTGTPFARNIPPEQLYENRSLREILGRLMYVADRKLFAVVTSDPGCGKSTEYSGLFYTIVPARGYR